MARNKNMEPSLQSWDDVDKCLREIGECEIAITEIEADMNIAINEAKERADKLSKPMKESIDRLEALVKGFAEETKADMDGKSKQLTFGRVGFRLKSYVSVPTAKEKLEAVLKNLRKFNMDDCIVVKESVNKEVLEKYSDRDIAKVGASRKVEDKFWMETDREKIRR